MGKLSRITGLLLATVVCAITPWLISTAPGPLEGTAFASDLGLTEADCRCCHSTGIPDRHHLLVETNNAECLDCHEMIWDAPSTSWVPIVTRDCLACHEGSLADRHHIVNNDCFACHEAIWDPASQSYFISFANGCAPKATIENCSDGYDNDGNDLIDCNDPYCAGTTACLPSTAEICSDGIDNNGDNLIDCDDATCVASPLCQSPQPESCSDAIDNDGNGLKDCADPACFSDPACVVPPVEVCSDGIDNDGDQWVDCDDPDCFGTTDCTVSQTELCTDGIDNDGNGLTDCADPDCTNDPNCETSPPDPTDHYTLHQVAANDCTGCHLDNLHDEHKKNCNYCHQNPNTAIQEAVAAASTNCTACHSATIHTMSCDNCHKNPNNLQLDTVHTRHLSRVACGACHGVPETVNLEPTGQYCIICHGTARPYTHAEVPDLHRTHVTGTGFSPYSCNMCHGQNIPQIRPGECLACHSDNRPYNPVELPTIHTTHSRLFDCTNCHFDPRLFALDDQTTACLRCHEMRPYTSTYALHLQHSGNSCWTCHTSSNGVTARSGYSCASCHDGATPSYRRLDRDVHRKHTSAGAPCWTCHSQLVPVFPTLQKPSASPSGAIAGTITGLHGGSVDHVTVAILESGHSTLTAADGSYRLDFISPDSYTLATSMAGYQTASQAVDVSIGYTSTVDLNLTPLPNTGTVSGFVVDGQGFPAVAAQVMSADLQYTATVGADGSYVLEPVVEGTYQLIASLYDHVEQTKAVTVITGQASTADFTLANLGPEACFDGLDNDGDGQIDCDDNNCGPECNALEEICGDGIDNDLDGAIDCFDNNCSPVCNSCTDNDDDDYYIDGGVCGAVDCNDADLLVHPGVTEICDGLDNNCDGQVDEGSTATFYLDSDGDGFGDATRTIQACSPPAGYVTDASDCNDASAAVNPGASESCDGLDNDCNGSADDGLQFVSYYRDFDADGFGDPAKSQNTCSGPPNNYILDNTDCEDREALVNPAATESLGDGLDNNCNGLTDCEDPALAADPVCSAVVCPDYSDATSCSADPSCEWDGGNKGKGSCEEAGSGAGEDIYQPTTKKLLNKHGERQLVTPYQIAGWPVLRSRKCDNGASLRLCIWKSLFPL